MNMDDVNVLFEQLLSDQNVCITDKQKNQFLHYYEMLVEWNQKTNLTAITEKEHVYIKHFYDSISLSFFIPLASFVTVADIGSGAGFPSIPLKIMYPHLRITIIDSLNKRIVFLRALVEKLGLDFVDCVHSRAEDAARIQQYRDQFDLVTARAVARLNVLNELCLPFVKPGGLFVAMKGAKAKDELADAKRSIRELKAVHEKNFDFLLPQEDAKRYMICLRKKGNTPQKYPRNAGVPAKKPLV